MTQPPSNFSKFLVYTFSLAKIYILAVQRDGNNLRQSPFKWAFMNESKVDHAFFHCSWTYQTEKELDGQSHWGRITTYSGGGFTMLLEATKEKTKAMIDILKVIQWNLDITMY